MEMKRILRVGFKGGEDVGGMSESGEIFLQRARAKFVLISPGHLEAISRPSRGNHCSHATVVGPEVGSS